MLQAQIFIDKDELRGSESLHHFIMHFLLEKGIAGATSFSGHSGFGSNQRLKLPAQEFSFDETPLLITFIDKKEKVVAVLTELRKHYKGGFVITSAVEKW